MASCVMSQPHAVWAYFVLEVKQKGFADEPARYGQRRPPQTHVCWLTDVNHMGCALVMSAC